MSLLSLAVSQKWKVSAINNLTRIRNSKRLLLKSTIKNFCNLTNGSLTMASSGRIPCERSELDLGITLNGGQSFRWTSINNGEKFRGTFAGHVWTLSQIEDNLFYRLHTKTIGNTDLCEEELKRYFNLQISLKDNVEKWSACDSHFEKSSGNVSGVRILDQDPVENLFSFICSSNNNIPRISSLVEKLCTNFGKKLCVVESKQYNSFPTIDALANPKVESLLRTEGFGYRASYIAKTAAKLKQLGGLEWLSKLHKSSDTSYNTAREKLMELPGIGPKVADCICLMSLGHLEAIPVDTHIFQIAQSAYMPHLEKKKTVTPRLNDEIGTYLRELWGPLAGWAQAIVFCAKISSNVDTMEKVFANNDENVDEGGTKKKQKKR